ncbi:MAG: hypothetical protein Q9219_006606 [cf. Caloplaca sp. 3 TL-2023]
MIRLPFVRFTFLVLTLTTLGRYAAAATCYEDRTKLHPAVYAQCLRVINLMSSVVEDPKQPLKFGDETQRPDIPLPTYWRDIRNNCVIGIHLKPEEIGSDRSNMDDLAKAAKDVAREHPSREYFQVQTFYRAKGDYVAMHSKNLSELIDVRCPAILNDGRRQG